MKKVILKIFLFILVLSYFGISFAQIGPVAPAKDATPQSQVKDVTSLNLSYQPADPTTIPNLDIPATIPVDQPMIEIDWTKIPFIPFKTPDLSPAPDPGI